MASFPVNNILFLDIETVPQFPDYSMLPEDWKQLWDTKSNSLVKYHEGEPTNRFIPGLASMQSLERSFVSAVVLYREVAISERSYSRVLPAMTKRSLLQQFNEMLVKWAGGEPKFLCAHNGKEFDFPYLCRRMIVHGISIPSLLNIAGKKPWEIHHFDTLELWKFGDFKSYTSLNLLAHTLGIATPKDDIDGSVVWEVYWKEKNLPRIIAYCQKDVITVAQILLRMNGESLIKEENIEIKG